MMRNAFHPEKGPQAEAGQVIAERKATQALFAGAIGLFKNPGSHRDVEYDPTVAGEAVLLADLLLRRLDIIAEGMSHSK